MNREIKFRGQTRRKGEYTSDPRENINNGHWVYGEICKSGSFYFILNEERRRDKHAVYPETVGQYIGTEDKNKNEIYDGDIVRTNSGRLCKVTWLSSPQHQGWDLEAIETKNPQPDKNRLWEDLEVIGNVYDDADLLNEEGKSKSILVIDAPESCIGCPCGYADEGMVFCKKESRKVYKHDYANGSLKPDWCPLLDFPKYKSLEEETDKDIALGWNRCLSEIMEKFDD